MQWAHFCQKYLCVASWNASVPHWRRTEICTRFHFRLKYGRAHAGGAELIWCARSPQNFPRSGRAHLSASRIRVRGRRERKSTILPANCVAVRIHANSSPNITLPSPPPDPPPREGRGKFTARRAARYLCISALSVITLWCASNVTHFNKPALMCSGLRVCRLQERQASWHAPVLVYGLLSWVSDGYCYKWAIVWKLWRVHFLKTFYFSNVSTHNYSHDNKFTFGLYKRARTSGHFLLIALSRIGNSLECFFDPFVCTKQLERIVFMPSVRHELFEKVKE